MIWLWLFLLGFFAWRAFLYFRGGRVVAGGLASLAVLLFAGAITISFLPKSERGDKQQTAANTAVGDRADGGSNGGENAEPEQPVIGAYDPSAHRSD